MSWTGSFLDNNSSFFQQVFKYFVSVALLSGSFLSCTNTVFKRNSSNPVGKRNSTQRVMKIWNQMITIKCFSVVLARTDLSPRSRPFPSFSWPAENRRTVSFPQGQVPWVLGKTPLMRSPTSLEICLKRTELCVWSMVGNASTRMWLGEKRVGVEVVLPFPVKRLPYCSWGCSEVRGQMYPVHPWHTKATANISIEKLLCRILDYVMLIWTLFSTWWQLKNQTVTF